MADNLTVEHHMRVYDDDKGWFVTVRPDRDGGNACEIAWNDGEDLPKDEKTIIMSWPMARAMAQAILGLETVPRG